MSTESEPKRLHSKYFSKEPNELYAEALKAHKDYVNAEDIQNRVGVRIAFVNEVANVAGEKYKEYKEAYEKKIKEYEEEEKKEEDIKRSFPKDITLTYTKHFKHEEKKFYNYFTTILRQVNTILMKHISTNIGL